MELMSNHRISLLRRVSVCGLVGVLVFSSCSYTSDYVAPSDGRARLVWHDGEPTAAVPTGTQACAAQAVRLSGRELDLGPCNNGRCAEPRFFWPVFYVGPPLLVPVPPHGLPPRSNAAPHRASPVGTKGSGGMDARAVIVVAALALVSMPIVAIALAASRPERPVEVAGAIDYVNTMNDVVRDPNNGCMNMSPPPPPPTPAPEGQP